MAFLGGLFGGGNDKLQLLYQMQKDQQARSDAATAAARDAQTAADLRNTNLSRRGQAVDSARAEAQSYLSSLGLDPAAYSSDIDQTINDALSSTAEDDPNIGQYISNLGEQVYNNKTNSLRSAAGRNVDLAFGPDYSYSKIADTLDDPILAEIGNQQRSKADDYVNNLVKRGVLTASGQGAAERNLDDQSARVRSILNELGKSSLDTGRSNLDAIANRARQTASTLTLGNNFDPGAYTSEASKAFDDFVSGLGDSIKSKLPGTPLYDTSTLAAIGGSAQGAGNYAFDPRALAGTNIYDDTTNNQTQNDQQNQKRITF